MNPLKTLIQKKKTHPLDRNRNLVKRQEKVVHRTKYGDGTPTQFINWQSSNYFTMTDAGEVVRKSQPIGLAIHTDLPFLFEVGGKPPSTETDTMEIGILYFLQPVKVKFNNEDLSFVSPQILVMTMHTPHSTGSTDDRNSIVVGARTSLSELKAHVLNFKDKGWSVKEHDTPWFAHITMSEEFARTIDTSEKTVHTTTPPWQRPQRTQWNFGVGFNTSQVNDHALRSNKAEGGLFR